MDIWLTVVLTGGGILVGVLVSFLIAKKYRSRKELTLYLLDYSSTVEVTNFLQDKVKIQYKKKTVGSLERIRLILQNTGNRAILKEDMKKSIEISFDDPIEIIEVDKCYSNCGKCLINIFGGNKIGVDFVLINPKEVIVVELLTSRAKKHVVISMVARGTELKIKGIEDVRVKTIAQRLKKSPRNFFLRVVPKLAVLVLLFVSIAFAVLSILFIIPLFIFGSPILAEGFLAELLIAVVLVASLVFSIWVGDRWIDVNRKKRKELKSYYEKTSEE